MTTEDKVILALASCEFQNYLAAFFHHYKVSYSAIGRIMGVNRITVMQFVKNRKLNSLQ